jgi:hypothetical protein
MESLQYVVIRRNPGEGLQAIRAEKMGASQLTATTATNSRTLNTTSRTLHSHTGKSPEITAVQPPNAGIERIGRGKEQIERYPEYEKVANMLRSSSERMPCHDEQSANNEVRMSGVGRTHSPPIYS